MRPVSRRVPARLTFAALLGLIALGGLAALSAPGNAPPAELQRLAGDRTPKRLRPRRFAVREFTFGSDRQPIIRKIDAASLWRVGGEYYVEERRTGEWLVGRLEQSDAAAPASIACRSRFRTVGDLAAASAYKPLPRAPRGLRLREVVRLPDFPVRLASDGAGKTLYILMVDGDVYQLNVRRRRLRRVLRGNDYHTVDTLHRQSLGLMLDKQGRIYISSNERLENQRPFRNSVTIFRAQTHADEWRVEAPRAWLKTGYPWGIGAFNHGVNNLALGPDGMLYVSSGSRTDGSETGDDPRYYRGGETPITACIWRLDPRAAQPKVEVFARGLRNAFGFCWNPAGEMIATDNGPDADAPGELNLIRQGKHYGFPYHFSNWTRKPYAYTPDPPPGQQFEAPIRNLGPAGGGTVGGPLFTVDAHSSPGAIVFIGDDFPARYRGGYFFTRFGNLLEGSRRVGYDLLFARLSRRPGGVDARIETVLAPLSRPVDAHLSGKGKLFILEYSRQHDNRGFAGNLPGRVLELSAR